MKSTPSLTVLSLGWGVQSFTLAAMSALGEISKLDAAVHSDTSWEREGTYTFATTWTPWLEAHTMPVVTVRDPKQNGTDPTGPNGEVVMPVYSAGDTQRGQLNRQCTRLWKMYPQRRWITQELKRRGLKKKAGSVEVWLGISKDEWQRVKDSGVQYIVNRYPLLELGMTRRDCERWLIAHNLPIPPKSACVFCPYQNLRVWEGLKRDGGSDWQVALAVDTMIRNQRPPDPLFVHPARLPLDQAVRIPEDAGYEQIELLSVEDDERATCDSGYCFV